MQKRPYGNTGEELSILSFGGIVVTNVTPKEADEYVGEGIDHGINYFDVAPSYGNAEERLGPALAPYRKDVFLACKTTRRDAAGAREELERSLSLMQTDHFDLYQLHAITTDEDIEKAFGPGGAMETFVKAREEGKVRYLGFSAHSVHAALGAMDRFDFNSLLFPFNYVTYEVAGFGPQVMEVAQKKGVARLALKAMARGPWKEGDPNKSEYSKAWYEPLADRSEAQMALRYSLSLPVTAAVPPGDIRLFRMAIEIAEDFQPLTPAELQEIRGRAQSETPLFTLSDSHRLTSPTASR
jgi:aryl-alcohol dehydrogenase-like predicted oxidoreductase